ncbi:hypothetical protein BVC80_7915g6 [Macleaya cordata]|uniref:Uncharacterized protein n=1 Tax=Macleaya cordata TaxID=56857 RepID=A0A200PMZ2_MACCD|nr:hypothetical protein BVC80_7915g6 [Macleaya cordata]
MEFRFQPNEDKASSTYFSPSTSSSNYFTEQALRAGYFSNGIRRTDFVSNSDPVREAIQREIEKERIREEILAAEIIRKRVLEAEVRREMALERELGFPLVPTSLHYQHNPVDNSRLQERFSLSSRSEVGNFNSLPFQRHPEAAKIFEIVER